MIASSTPTNERLTILSEPFARGKERACFLHPLDPKKIIKISTGTEDIQTRREITFFEDLQKRRVFDYRHLPHYYGTVETNLGRGLVFELICDANGEISRSLQWYLENGIVISQAESLLRELKQYMLDNLIIFNHDLFSGNLLLQKNSDDSAKLIIIDGLGDVVRFPWLNRFPSHVHAKIERRWERFMTRFYNNKYVASQLSSDT